MGMRRLSEWRLTRTGDNSLNVVNHIMQKSAWSFGRAMRATAFWMLCLCYFSVHAQSPAPKFKVIAFYTGREDLAHISFVHEANRWFPQMADQHHFSFVATTNWNELNTAFLQEFQVVLFLDTRPEVPAQRQAFQAYM